jgi:hypothetical protein
MFAQGNTKHHEAGIVFTGFNGFGLSYKYGGEHSQCRLKSVLFRSANSQNSDSDFDNAYDVRTDFGYEWLKPVTSNLRFRLGVDVFFDYGYVNSKTNLVSTGLDANLRKRSQSYSPGAALVLGFDYIIKEHLVLSAELTPSAYFTYQKVYSMDFWSATHQYIAENTKTTSVGASMSNRTMELGIAYRF